MALGAIWADGLWDEAIWNNAIWEPFSLTPACDQFTFSDRAGQALSATNVESGAVTLTNVDGTQNVTFSGDASLEWSKNGGVWSTGSTTVVSGDTLNLRLDASASYLTQVSAVVTVGSGANAVSDTYAVITIPNPATPADGIAQKPISGKANTGIKGNING